MEYLLWGGVILIEVFNSIKFVTTVVGCMYMHFVVHYLFKVGQN